jgi:hypothetical protein
VPGFSSTGTGLPGKLNLAETRENLRQQDFNHENGDQYEQNGTVKTFQYERFEAAQQSGHGPDDKKQGKKP